MLVFSLSQWGHRVVAASSGPEALELARTQPFLAVLCDISMPNMGGLEVLRSLKTLQPALPVIMMTGSPSAESAREAGELGAFGYITKPFHLAELEELISRAIQPAGGARHEL